MAIYQCQICSDYGPRPVNKISSQMDFCHMVSKRNKPFPSSYESSAESRVHCTSPTTPWACLYEFPELHKFGFSSNVQDLSITVDTAHHTYVSSSRLRSTTHWFCTKWPNLLVKNTSPPRIMVNHSTISRSANWHNYQFDVIEDHLCSSDLHMQLCKYIICYFCKLKGKNGHWLSEISYDDRSFKRKCYYTHKYIPETIGQDKNQ